MDAGYVHDYVRMDAGGIGIVLDGVKPVWYCPDANHKTYIKIKMPHRGIFIKWYSNVSGVYTVRLAFESEYCVHHRCAW